MIALAAALLSGQSAPPARSAEDLTRDLNSAPPSAAAPVAPRPSPPATQSEPQPAQPQPAQPSPAQPSPAPSSPAGAAPSRPSAAPATQAAPTGSTSSVTRGLNSAPPSATPAPRASPPAPAASTVRPASPPAPRPAPASAPAPAPTTASAAPTPTPTPAAAPAEAAAEALPFRIDLPEGFEIEPADAGPQAKVYTVRKDGRSFVMIYQGPASQFPIYDGQLIDAGGRASVVIEEDGRRRAVEHLFAKDLESRETHVWLSYLEGPDSAQAEQIAQSVEPR